MFLRVNVAVVLSHSVLDECVEVHPCSAINATPLWEKVDWEGGGGGTGTMWTALRCKHRPSRSHRIRCQTGAPHKGMNTSCHRSLFSCHWNSPQRGPAGRLEAPGYSLASTNHKLSLFSSSSFLPSWLQHYANLRWQKGAGPRGLL